MRSSPPVSKHTPLPTSVTFGALSSPQASSTSRGARALAAPDGVDRRIVLREQRRRRRSPLLARPCCSPTCRARFGQFRRSQVRGRRVDQVAGQADRVGEPLNETPIGKLWARPAAPCLPFSFCGRGRTNRCREPSRARNRPRFSPCWARPLGASRRCDNCRAAAIPGRPAAAHIAASPSPIPASTRPSRPSSAGSSATFPGSPVNPIAAAQSRSRPATVSRHCEEPGL